MYGIRESPDGNVYDLDNYTVNGEPADDAQQTTIDAERALKDAVAANQARRAEEDTAATAAESLRQTMFDLTNDIIDWCEDAQAYIYTAGAQGALDVNPGYITLLQRAESALLASKALAIRTEGVNEQERWMLQRGQQAQSLLGLAAVLG